MKKKNTTYGFEIERVVNRFYDYRGIVNLNNSMNRFIYNDPTPESLSNRGRGIYVSGRPYNSMIVSGYFKFRFQEKPKWISRVVIEDYDNDGQFMLFTPENPRNRNANTSMIFSKNYSTVLSNTASDTNRIDISYAEMDSNGYVKFPFTLVEFEDKSLYPNIFNMTPTTATNNYPSGYFTYNCRMDYINQI